MPKAFRLENPEHKRRVIEDDTKRDPKGRRDPLNKRRPQGAQNLENFEELIRAISSVGRAADS